MIVLTKKAADEIKLVLEGKFSVNDRTKQVLRVGVSGGGCSGFQYSLGFDTETSADDVTLEQYGITVVVSKSHDLYLDGTELDYYDGLEKRGFVFENPNAVKSCGCGESFSA